MLDRVLRRDKTKSNVLLLSIAWSSICPAFIAFMLVMDQVFVINSTIFEAVALLLSTCFYVGCIFTCVEKSYELLFSMKMHEVNGFRRMRTIT